MSHWSIFLHLKAAKYHFVCPSAMNIKLNRMQTTKPVSVELVKLFMNANILNNGIILFKKTSTFTEGGPSDSNLRLFAVLDAFRFTFYFFTLDPEPDPEITGKDVPH